MAGSSLPQSLDETTRLYARPLGVGFKEDGLSFPLAGGPRSFSGLQIILSGKGGRLFEAAFPLTALPSLKADLPKSLASVLDQTLEALTQPRAPIGPLSFEKPLLMGILNVTPDSFSDGGDFLGTEEAKARALGVFQEGADLIDIGAESTRPGAKPVPEPEEIRRLKPVLEIISKLPGPVSIDTRKASIMAAALKSGALLINDVSALTFDEKALKIARNAPGIVLMHTKGRPEDMQDNPTYQDVVLEVYDYLEKRLQVCESAGIPRKRVIIDPGIGFGKTTAHNLALLRDLSLFQGLGVAVLAGVSRKRFIGEIAGLKDPRDRVSGSVSASLFALGQGAQMVRCHDVKEMRQAIDVYQSITSFG